MGSRWIDNRHRYGYGGTRTSNPHCYITVHARGGILASPLLPARTVVAAPPQINTHVPRTLFSNTHPHPRAAHRILQSPYPSPRPHQASHPPTSYRRTAPRPRYPGPIRGMSWCSDRFERYLFSSSTRCLCVFAPSRRSRSPS
jgi:hypothetical protein